MNITIVGAGVIGCVIAYELASRGARVRLIDPRGVGAGATRASAGILAPYIEGHSPSLLRLGVSSLSMYDAFIERLEQDAHTKIEYRRDGTLQVALDASQDAALRAAASRLEAAGVGHVLMDGAEARHRERSLGALVSSALLTQPHGFVAAQALTRALAAAAAARGALTSTERVLSLAATGGTPQVITESSRFSSDAVIIAAGSWSSQLAGQQPPTAPVVRPIRGQLLHLRADTGLFSHVLWGVDCYLVPWADGSILAGATVEDVGFDETPTQAGIDTLQTAAAALLPAVAGARLEDVRVGLRPKTADELPVIGPSSTMPHVIHATGHYRNGVLLAPLTAALVADLVLQGIERPELAATRPARFGL